MRTFRELYRAGHLDETPVDIELPPASQSEGRDRKVNIENGGWVGGGGGGATGTRLG
jgi:hypothetical protein